MHCLVLLILQLLASVAAFSLDQTSKRSSTFETAFAANRVAIDNQQVQSTAANGSFSMTKLKRKLSRRKTSSKLYQIAYDYDELIIGNSTSNNVTAVMLVHPIGVGIGRWYHDRLLKSLADDFAKHSSRVVFLSPDLLGSYTACSPVEVNNGQVLQKFPLLNITDWSDQLQHLMSEYECKCEISNWSIVSNGGCAPIALKVAQSAVDKSAPFQKALTNVVISSPPRLPFFLEGTDTERVQKSYRKISGIVGNAFWWYALRKEGKFIQTFSERNLFGDPASLGKRWTPNCITAARHLGGKSRYSTFAFLAGALQDGCMDSLNSLKGSEVKIDFIRGTGRKERRRPRSFFWKRKVSVKPSSELEKEAQKETTIEEYIERNGNRGRVAYIDAARISLAWEDSASYARELMALLDC
jgi:hypothetical protein